MKFTMFINTTAERLRAGKVLNLNLSAIYFDDQLKSHALVSCAQFFIASIAAFLAIIAIFLQWKI